MSNSGKQINPLSLPSETTLAFWVLVVSVFLGAASDTRFTAATVRGWTGHTGNMNDGWNWAVGPAFILIVLLLFFFTEPMKVLQRCGGAALLDSNDEKMQRVAHLAASLGLRPPDVWLCKGGVSLDAQAFGTFAPNLLLGRGLAFAFVKSPTTFDTVVLHELGHVIHKDIRNGYLARAALAAFLTLTALNLAFVHTWFISGFFNSPSCASMGATIWRCAYVDVYRLIANTLIYLPLVLVAVLSYATFLRYREFYADQVASANGGRLEMKRMFDANGGKSRLSWLERLLAFHPNTRERAKALTDPFVIFSNTKWLTLLIGILLGATRENVERIGAIWDVLRSAESFLSDTAASGDYSLFLSPPPSFIFGAAFGLLLYIGFIAIARVGTRTGLVVASTPWEAKRAMFETLQCLILFILGLNFAGPLLISLGSWMDHGFPPSLIEYFSEDLVGEVCVVCAGAIGSAIPAYFVGRIFGHTYRPRFMLIFCYWSGWVAMNITTVVFHGNIAVPEGLSLAASLAVLCGIYWVFPGIVAFTIDSAMQWRRNKINTKTLQSERVPTHWLLAQK